MKGFQRLALSALWDDGLREVFAALEKPLQQVEEFLRQAVQSPVRDITEMALHLLSAGGKRLRPALTLLSAQLVGSHFSCHHFRRRGGTDAHGDPHPRRCD